MRTSNCNLRAFAAAVSFVTALCGLTASLPAGAGSITYTDPVCREFYTVPGQTFGDVVLRCVQMSCSVSTDTSYIVPVNTTVTLTARCTTTATGFSWRIAARSPQGCPAPSSPNTAAMQVVSSTPMTCWYDVVANDSPNTNQGAARYGIVWTSAPASCVATASPTSLPASSGPVALAVACAAGGPLTSTTWTRNGTPLGAVTGDTPPANSSTSPQTYTYAATPCNAAACSPTAFAAPVVTVAASAGVIPSGCTITPSPSASIGSGGGNIGMTVSCTVGAPFTQFNWRKNSVAFGFNTATQNDTLPANSTASPVSYTYDVEVCNAAGCAARITQVFTVQASVASGMCTGYGSVVQEDLPWNTSPDFVTSLANGPLTWDGVFVGRIVVPANATSASALGHISWAEFAGGPTHRLVTVSTQPCDFRGYPTSFPTDPTGSTAPLKWSGGPSGDVFYSIAPNAGTPMLNAGQVYYLNIRNADFFGNPTCTSSTCDLIVHNVSPR